jgi:hypothetical protein
VLRRKSAKRLVFSNFDRLVFASLYRIAPRIVDALVIVQPETVVRWHHAGFCLFWRWKARRRGGRPKVQLEIRRPIREMSLANPLWGAPRIQGELLKIGIDVGQTSVAKYMGRHRRTPIARVEDVPPQPCRWDRLDGYLRRSDNLVSPAIPTLSMATFSPGGFVPWAFATGQPRRNRHGRMAIRNG